MKILSRHPSLRGAMGMLIAGAIQALTFAPGPLPDEALAPVQILALAVLAYRQLTAPSLRRAWWEGWLFNTACYAVGLYWLFISLHTYGGLASPLAATAILIFAAFLALFPAIAGVLARWLAPLVPHARAAKRLRSVLAFAACWTVLEWIRGTIWTGFPWLNIGYAHLNSFLTGWAAVLGVYGVAWLAAFTAAALASLVPFVPRQEGVLSQTLPLMVAVMLMMVGVGLSTVQWARPMGAPLHVRLIQGNIEQSQKFDPLLAEQSLRQHLHQAALPSSPKDPGLQLIVLPETVLPIFQDKIDASIWELWLRTARAQGATLIMGTPLHQKHNGLSRYTNSAIGFDGATPIRALRTGHLAMRYDKHHLVPWGEFVPPAFHWLVRMLDIPLGNFDRGRLHQAPFDIADQRIALNICYEDLFGEELLSAIRTREGRHSGASIFLNLSNLGWFGHSWALRQHLQISRMRALETARPFLTATNTGVTAAIDPQGHVIAQAPAWQTTSLNTTVQGMTGLTPYARIGNLLIGAVALIILLGLSSLRIAEIYAARRQTTRQQA